MQPGKHQFSRSHVSIGAIRRSAEFIALFVLADKIKSPEQRYLVLAGVGLVVGAAETAWRDHVKRERQACRDRIVESRLTLRP